MKPYYQDSAVTIYHGDCREILPSLGKFDLLLTDPPYGINQECDNTKIKDGRWDSLRKKHIPVFGDDKPFDPTPFLAYPLSIIWGANCFSNRLPIGSWLFWDKRADNGSAFRSQGEVAFMSKGRSIYYFDHCWQGFSRASDFREHYHPTQKPVALMKWCIHLAGKPHTILDPFAGSGTTGRAAKDLGKKATLIEREERYCEIAAKRMAQEVLAL